MAYRDHVEQLTCLLFLKIVDEQVEYEGKERRIPEGLDWRSLLDREGEELECR